MVCVYLPDWISSLLFHRTQNLHDNSESTYDAFFAMPLGRCPTTSPSWIRTTTNYDWIWDINYFGMKFIFVYTWKLHSCTIHTHQVLSYRLPCVLSQMAFPKAVKSQGCISGPMPVLRKLIGLHGVPNCFWQQLWPALWILSVYIAD